MTKDKEITILWEIIRETLWMARRYAHGRHTYAPSIIRDAIFALKKIDPTFEMKNDVTISAPTHELKGFQFRSDYLDDL